MPKIYTYYYSKKPCGASRLSEREFLKCLQLYKLINYFFTYNIQDFFKNKITRLFIS